MNIHNTKAIFSSKHSLTVFAFLFVVLAFSSLISLFYSPPTSAAEVDRWVSRDEISFRNNHYFYFGTSSTSSEILQDTEFERFFSDTEKRIYAKGSKSGSEWTRSTAVCSHKGGNPYYGTSVPAGGFILVSGTTTQLGKVTDNGDGTCSVSLENKTIPNATASHSLFTRFEEKGQTPYILNVIGGDERRFTFNKTYSSADIDVYIKDGYEASYPCKDAITFEKGSKSWFIYPIDEKSIVEDQAPFARNLVPTSHAQILYDSTDGLSAQECRVNPREMVGGFGLRVEGSASFEKKTENMDEPDFPGLKNEDCDGFVAQKYKYARYAIDCKKDAHRFGDDRVDITYIDGDGKYDFHNPGGSDKDFKAYITLGAYGSWFFADAGGRYKILAPVQTVKNQTPPGGINLPEDQSQDDQSSDEATTCAIDGIGWIVCPVMRFMGKLNDAAFALIANFLTVEPKLLTDPETESAWKTFRDLANALFVVFFLIILYSQMTGAGISNYGIKKLLPKLVVAAILVNLSFYITQIAVDLSNIVGSSMYGFFKDMPTATDATADFSGGLSWEKVIGYAIAATAAILVALLLAFTLGTAALLAFAMTVVILIARKAALILLVVISPLAFVAYLLPNTEDFFKKWWKMFSTLLMVFPIIGVVFGASTLAARIINNSAGNPDDSSVLLQLTALGILAVPLFAVPILLKGATSAMGTIGQKLSGWQDKANSATAGKGKERWGNTAYMRGRAARKAGKDAYRNEKFAGAVNDPKTGWQRLRGRAARGFTPPVTRAGRKGLEHLDTAAFAAANKHDNEEVGDMADKLTSDASKHVGGDMYSIGGADIADGANGHLAEELHKAIQSKNSVEARAAMTALRTRQGGTEAIQKVLQATHDAEAFTGNDDASKSFRSDFTSHVTANRGTYDGKDGRISQFADSYSEGSITATDVSRLTQEQIGTQTGASIRASNISGPQATAVLQNKDVIASAKQGTIDALVDMGGTR